MFSAPFFLQPDCKEALRVLLLDYEFGATRQTSYASISNVSKLIRISKICAHIHCTYQVHEYANTATHFACRNASRDGRRLRDIHGTKYQCAGLSKHMIQVCMARGTQAPGTRYICTAPRSESNKRDSLCFRKKLCAPRGSTDTPFGQLVNIRHSKTQRKSMPSSDPTLRTFIRFGRAVDPLLASPAHVEHILKAVSRTAVAGNTTPSRTSLLPVLQPNPSTPQPPKSTPPMVRLSCYHP